MKTILYFFAIALFVPGISFAQFGEKQTLNHATNMIYSIVPVDYDNDMDNDIFVTSDENRIIFYENAGNDSLADEKVISVSSFRIINCADVNNDGHKELLGTNNNSIGWFENNLNNDFSVFHAISSGIGSVFACDMDADGDSDLFVGYYSLNKLAWFQNLGGGVFGPEQVLSTTVTNVNDIQFVDINNDGHIDIITASYPQIIIESFLNNGSNLFTQANVWNDYMSSQPGYYFKPFLYDYDHDGFLDIFHSNGLLVCQQNLGNGTFDDTYYQIIDYNSHSILNNIGDFNNDGLLDILYGSDYPLMSATGIEIQISGKPNQTVIYNFFYLSSNIMVFDFNNDGYKDIIEGLNSGRVLWYPNDGNWNFTHYIPLNKSSYYPTVFWPVDYDNDSDTDIVCLYHYDCFLAWYENTGNGVFLPEKIIIDSLRFYPVAASTSLTDIDNDGDFDFIYNDQDFFNPPTGLYILKNNSGAWDTTRIDTTGFRIIKVDDINGDNYKDILFQTQYGYGINAFINDGTGSFPVYQQIYNPGQYNYYDNFILFDIDQDGDKDILAARTGGNDSLQWIINDGSGNYLSKINLLYFGCSGGQMNIYPTDIDEDSDYDIIFGAACNIYLLKNDGSNNFNTFCLYSSYTDVEYSLEVIDIDVDGDKDIVYITESGIYWIENVNGVFSASQNLILPANNIGLYFATANLDNDQTPDLITVHQNNELNWYKNYMNFPFKIKGSMYYDANQSGVRDTLEPGFLHTQVNATPGALASFTNQNGDYWIAVDTGTYHVSTAPLPHWEISSPYNDYNVNISIAQQVVDTCIFGFYPDSLFTEVEPDLIFSGGFCGSHAQFWISVKNTGTMSTRGIIKLEHDTLIDYYMAQSVPDSVINNELYWHFDNLNFFEEKVFWVVTSWPFVSFMDSIVYNKLTVYALDTSGAFICSFIDSTSEVVACSYDPNDKTVEPAGTGQEHIIPQTQQLQYTVRFQNTGNDTAVNIVIHDTLDCNLDENSFEFLSSSHPVRISLEANVVIFEFDSIMLPDSISDEILSHGYVKYKVKPINGVNPNTEINNTAYIYFDCNPAVVTNTIFNTIECYIVPPVPVIYYYAGYLAVATGYAMQWYLDGVALPGETADTISPVYTGNYTVEVFNQFGCSTFSDPYHFVLVIPDNYINQLLTISPNPASSDITIKWNSDITPVISIVSTSGKCVYSRQTDAGNYANIDVSGYPQGVYFVKVVGKEFVETRKLIIQ